MQCAHDICTCLIMDGDEYCSPSCRTGVEGTSQCFCGHPDCTASRL
jgi:hypothetical protein